LVTGSFATRARAAWTKSQLCILTRLYQWKEVNRADAQIDFDIQEIDVVLGEILKTQQTKKSDTVL